MGSRAKCSAVYVNVGDMMGKFLRLVLTGGTKSKNLTGLFWFLKKCKDSLKSQRNHLETLVFLNIKQKHVILVGQAIGAGFLAGTFSLVTHSLMSDLWEVSGTKHATF